jgi:Na+-transporting NADH:ubiquinone oxidoreductase subunit F
VTELFFYSVVTLALLGGLFASLLLIADRLLADYGPCEVAVNEEEPVTVEGGCTLLEALYDNRVFIPSGCGGQGTCGHCKVVVLSGGGPLLPTELPFLTAEDIEAGVRLACQVKVKRDVRVRVREEYLHVQEFRAVVSAARAVTHDIRELRLRLLEPPAISFRPGQYVQVQVPTRRSAEHRAYSISSPPEQTREIELVVRLVPGGLGSTYLHRIEVGEELAFTGPYGDFALSEDPETEIVCVAGGCGIAPARSILRHATQRWPERPCALFFGVRTSRDVFYLEELEEAARRRPNLRVYYALSEPERGTNWQGETGFIHLSVERHLEGRRPRQAFLCGPEPMIEATEEVLRARGVPEEMIYYDSW